MLLVTLKNVVGRGTDHTKKRGVDAKEECERPGCLCEEELDD